MVTAVTLNIGHAKLLVAGKQKADEVISFCPNATYFLRNLGYKVTSTVDRYGACSHARVVVLAAKEMKLITESAIQQYGLDDLQSTALATHLHNFLCCSYHLHFCLKPLRLSREEWCWVDGGHLLLGSYDQMFTSLAQQMGADILSYAYTRYSPAHGLLAMLYNAVLFFFVRNSRSLKVIDYGDELPKRIIQAMIDNGENPLVFHTRTVCKNAYKTTHFFIKSLARLCFNRKKGAPLYIFRVANSARYKAPVTPFATPKLYAPALQHAVKRVVENAVSFIRIETSMGRDIVLNIKPDIAVSEHAIYAHVLGGLDELCRRGGKHAMINHATHTVQHGSLSRWATLSWGSQQHIITPYTTHALPKSPLTEALYSSVRTDKNYETHRINVYGKVDNDTRSDGRFVILQAGNYTDPYHHVPWCKETADEYLLAILELVEEVGKLDNAELIIKLKNKKSSTHKAIVQAHIDKLGVGDKVRVDTTSKFSELMARAHLVVCNLSGTIEEALANHIPVMLHSYRKTYFHIDEETVRASTIDGLSPAYLVKRREDIGRIITRLDARRSELRNPELFAKVAWQEKELTSIHDFAKDLVNSARRRSM